MLHASHVTRTSEQDLEKRSSKLEQVATRLDALWTERLSAAREADRTGLHSDEDREGGSRRG